MVRAHFRATPITRCSTTNNDKKFNVKKVIRRMDLLFDFQLMNALAVDFVVLLFELLH